jgi:hypothetical protein
MACGMSFLNMEIFQMFPILYKNIEFNRIKYLFAKQMNN